MKHNDISKMINLIRITYQGAYQTTGEEQERLLITLWQDLFKGYQDEVIMTAFRNCLKSCTFAPKPADIIQEADKIIQSNNKSGIELWNELTDVLYLVDKNSNNFNYTAIEENGKTQGENARVKVTEIFNGLAEATKVYLGNAGTLIELSKFTTEQLSFEKSRYLKALPTIEERLKFREQATALMGGNGNKLLGE